MGGKRERVNYVNILENEEMTALSFTGLPRANIEADLVILKVRGF